MNRCTMHEDKLECVQPYIRRQTQLVLPACWIPVYHMTHHAAWRMQSDPGYARELGAQNARVRQSLFLATLKKEHTEETRVRFPSQVGGRRSSGKHDDPAVRLPCTPVHARHAQDQGRVLKWFVFSPTTNFNHSFCLFATMLRIFEVFQYDSVNDTHSRHSPLALPDLSAAVQVSVQVWRRECMQLHLWAHEQSNAAHCACTCTT